MEMHKKVVTLNYLLIIFLKFTYCQLCDNCDGTSVSTCVTQTSYRLCNMSIPLIFQCPDGSNCINIPSSLNPCTTDTNLLSPCGTCGLYNFACLSADTVALCSDNVPSAVTSKCPAGTRCDSTSPLICIPDQQITTPSLTNPDEFCLNKLPGRYTNRTDLTCKSYIQCFRSFGGMVGQNYQCMGLTFFNCRIGLCTVLCDNTC